MNLIDEIDQEATRRDYLALSVCVGYPDSTEKLIHFTDADRREQFEKATSAGAVPVGVFWIMHCSQFGYVAGSKCFTDDPTWKHVFDRERTIMANLIANDPDFRTLIAEREPRIH